MKKRRRGFEKHKQTKKMACSVSVPFNNQNLDTSFFVFKPTVVIVDDLVHGLKQFSLTTESLGCVQSSIFRSIHGNMVTFFAFSGFQFSVQIFANFS